RWSRTSALSNLARFPGLERDDFDARCLLPELVRGAGEQREGAVMARDAALAAEQLERDAGLARVHREVPADWEDGDVRRVDPADQLHVAENARVPGEVDRGAVFEREHEPGRLAQVGPVVGCTRVEGIHESELHAGRLNG